MVQSSSSRVDVLIVGAGPVGLFLANECARRGLRFRIVEEHSGQSEYSKALAIFPRTLEVFDMAGIVGPFMEAANRVTNVAVMSHDHTLARIHFEPDQTPYPYVAMVPQDVTEKLLVEELRRRGGNVEYKTRFVSMEQDEEHVCATLEREGRPERIEASFVVGCDGAHSMVRKSLGIQLEGGDYDTPFMLADIETDDSLPGDEMQLCPSEHGPVAIFPMSTTRRRVVATIDNPEGDAPSLELTQRVLAERAPEGIRAKAMHWSSYFRIHYRHAEQLRKGRAFIAGDAAHIHSPFGGQGMNTGLHDIWNLVWKLDMHLRGHGSELLLDSYTAERVPIIKDVIETTDRLTKVMGTPHKLAQFLRDAIIPAVSHFSGFQHAFVRRLSGLGIDYAGSPIVQGEGERAFEESMRAGNMAGSRFLLLVNEGLEAGVKSAAQDLVAEMGDVLELRNSQGPGIRLVRPDGYVASASRDSDKGGVEELRILLHRMTDAPVPATRR